MKKLLVVVCCIGAFALAGCGSDETPETFGKKYIEKKFENINCELEDLDYKVIEDGEDAAKVIIEGKIKYKEEIQLVKKGDKWVVGKKPVKKADAEKKDAKKEEATKPAKAEKKDDHAKKAAPASH